VGAAKEGGGSLCVERTLSLRRTSPLLPTTTRRRYQARRCLARPRRISSNGPTAIASVPPTGVLAEQHRRMAEPGSGTKPILRERSRNSWMPIHETSLMSRTHRGRTRGAHAKGDTTDTKDSTW